jgi:outer membrane protein assembly factor BamA
MRSYCSKTTANMTNLRCWLLGGANVNLRLLLSAVLWCGFLLTVPWVPAQQPSPGKMRLSKIDFTGLQRHSPEQAIAASGLQIGQLVDIPTLDAAAQRLFDSGLFKKLSYRYRTTGNQAVVTFQTEEDTGAAVPVVFDNFVWFSDEELLSAIQQQIPSFAGTANDSATNGITKALQQLLQDRKMSGRVEYIPSGDLSGGTTAHIFSVEGVSVPICTVHFSGATAKHESDLIKTSKPLIATDYKQSFVRPFATINLIPIYRERGHLRAKFGTPTAKIESDTPSDCKGGVSVTVPVEEGPLYSWGKAEWAGNAALSNPELEAALRMKTGDLANGLKIDKGLGAVQGAYGKKGYILAKLKTTPVFEDTGPSVTYQIEVTEGPQYHMGMLTITGLSEDRTNELKRKWKLQPGSVYDDSYLNEFLKKDLVLDASEIGYPPKRVTSELKLNRQKFIVEVTISLSKEPAN